MSNEPKGNQSKEQVVQLYQGAKRIQPKLAKGRFAVIPPFLIELMGRKSKALLLFKNRWTTIY